MGMTAITGSFYLALRLFALMWLASIRSYATGVLDVIQGVYNEIIFLSCVALIILTDILITCSNDNGEKIVFKFGELI